jgi:hypothetical protein
MPIDMRLRNLESRARGLGENLRSQKAIVRGQGQLVMHESSLDVDVSIRTSEILNRISNLESHVTTIEDDLADLQENSLVTLDITSSNSPYAIANKNVILFCDTTSGDVTVFLKIADGTNSVSIVNCGSSNNDVIVTPRGTDLLIGVNESMTLSDRNRIDLNDSVTKGWY